MRRIETDFYPLSGPTFKTMEAAIRHSEAFGPLIRARRDAEQLDGSQIVDGFWTDTDCVIRFSNGKHLHIYVHPTMAKRNLDWRVVQRAPDLAETEIRQIGAPPVELVFPKSGAYVMDCSALIAARRGKDFSQLWVTEDFFYLYTPKQLILSFACVFRRDKGGNLLYLWEGD